MKVEVNNLFKKYGKKTILDDVSFSIDDNEIIAVAGPNGTGKTTLLEMMMTLRSFDSGHIVLMGMDLENKNLNKIREKIGVIFQEGGMYAYLKTSEVLKLFASFYDLSEARIEEVVALFDLSSHMGTKYHALSGGWKQRVLLAIAFLHKPELLFLDEPTTGLDPEAAANLWEAINLAKDEGSTIILSTHSMEEVEIYADRVMVLNQKKLACYDTPQVIKDQYNVRFFKEAYFQIIKGGN
jgi:ABC-type multidrug transport system ATPase subunit